MTTYTATTNQHKPSSVVITPSFLSRRTKRMYNPSRVTINEISSLQPRANTRKAK